MYKSRVLSTLDFKYVGFKHRQPVLQLLPIIIYMMIQCNSDTNSPGLTQIKAKALALQVCLYFRYKPQVQATHISYKKRIPVISLPIFNNLLWFTQVRNNTYQTWQVYCKGYSNLIFLVFFLLLNLPLSSYPCLPVTNSKENKMSDSQGIQTFSFEIKQSAQRELKQADQ